MSPKIHKVHLDISLSFSVFLRTFLGLSTSSTVFPIVCLMVCQLQNNNNLKNKKKHENNKNWLLQSGSVLTMHR